MKDLYKRIGLAGPTDDTSAIAQGIQSVQNTDPASARAAEYVLLNATRKASYDRSYPAMVLIGKLRSNLGLAKAANGLACDSSDFIVKPVAAQNQWSKIKLKRLRKPAAKSSRWGEVVGGIAILLVGTCLLGVIFGDNPSSTNGKAGVTQRVPPAGRPSRTSQEEHLRGFVLSRYQKAGLDASSQAVDQAVHRLVNRQTEVLPSTGLIVRNYLGWGDVAPLKIVTVQGRYYFVKVVDWSSKRLLFTAFIHGGEPFEVTVPVGSYEIRYASGTEWYGPTLDFGATASYAKCDERFDFTLNRDGSTSGFTIELIMQEYGNLETEPISDDEF
jgi:hypothetical protein